MTSVSAGQIILTPTQPVGSVWSQRRSNPGPPHPRSGTLYRLSYILEYNSSFVADLFEDLSQNNISLCMLNNPNFESQFFF